MNANNHQNLVRELLEYKNKFPEVSPPRPDAMKRICQENKLDYVAYCSGYHPVYGWFVVELFSVGPIIAFIQNDPDLTTND